MKAKVSSFFPLLTNIKNAQEAYYLANGQYVKDIRDLDIELPSSCTALTTAGMEFSCGPDFKLVNGGFGSPAQAAGHIALFYCPGASTNATKCVNTRPFSFYFYYHNPAKEDDKPKADKKNCETKNNSDLGRAICKSLDAVLDDVYL